MVKDKKQLLRNPDIEPSDDVIAEALGGGYISYVKFIKELDNKDIQPEWRYYNDGKAWLAKGIYKWIGARGGKKETTVFWLSIWDGFFKATIYFPEKVRADVLDLPLDNEIKKVIEDSEQMGKLKYFPVVFELYTDKMFDSVFQLIDFRKKVK